MNRGFLRNLILVGVYLTYFPLILLTMLIVWLDRKIGFPLSFPRDVAELAKQKDWCVSALKENGVLPADAQVLEYKVTPLIQEIIFRSNAGVIDIHYTSNGESKSLKCFAKFAPTMGSVWNRTIFNLQLNHIKEIYFNNYFVTADKEVAAPKVFYGNLAYFTANLCLITEHMTDNMEYREGDNANFSEEHLELVLKNMAALHARYWHDSSPRMNKVFPIIDATVDLFDSMVAFSWSIPARKILVKSWVLMNKPETVLHGDARIGNMLFPSAEGKGRFVFIDWQAVRKGKAAFDLAYFMVLSLTPDYRVEHEQQAIDVYYNHLIAKGVQGYSREQFEEDYRHACLCLLVLLSLPMLSGEASVEGVGALIFAYGMNIWRERLQIKFAEFDYAWLAQHYGITEQEGRNAVAEMLGVIEKRLAKINAENAVETTAKT